MKSLNSLFLFPAPKEIWIRNKDWVETYSVEITSTNNQSIYFKRTDSGLNYSESIKCFMGRFHK